MAFQEMKGKYYIHISSRFVFPQRSVQVLFLAAFPKLAFFRCGHYKSHHPQPTWRLQSNVSWGYLARGRGSSQQMCSTDIPPKWISLQIGIKRIPSKRNTVPCKLNNYPAATGKKGERKEAHRQDCSWNFQSREINQIHRGVLKTKRNEPAKVKHSWM